MKTPGVKAGKIDKLFVLYDERAVTDSDSAAIYSTAYTEDDARDQKRRNFPNAVIMCYDVDTDGKTLLHERRIK